MPQETAKAQFLKKPLEKMQRCIKNKHYTIDLRHKNFDYLFRLNMTVLDQEAIMLQLTERDFRSYEEDNDDPSSEPYWKFKTHYCNQVFYVKFKIIEVGEDFIFIKSLHIDGE